MLHSEIIPEHSCDGELVPLKEDGTYIRVVRFYSCGTEFSYETDSIWVTFVLPGMRDS